MYLWTHTTLFSQTLLKKNYTQTPRTFCSKSGKMQKLLAIFQTRLLLWARWRPLPQPSWKIYAQSLEFQRSKSEKVCKFMNFSSKILVLENFPRNKQCQVLILLHVKNYFPRELYESLFSCQGVNRQPFSWLLDRKNINVFCLCANPDRPKMPKKALNNNVCRSWFKNSR